MTQCLLRDSVFKVAQCKDRILSKSRVGRRARMSEFKAAPSVQMTSGDGLRSSPEGGYGSFSSGLPPHRAQEWRSHGHTWGSPDSCLAHGLHKCAPMSSFSAVELDLQLVGAVRLLDKSLDKAKLHFFLVNKTSNTPGGETLLGASDELFSC